VRASLLIHHWQLSIGLAVQALLAVALYRWAARRGRGRWPARRTASFIGGVACIVIALCSGIDTYDERLLSVHMVQHMILLLLAPLLLLGGQPVLLALKALPVAQRRTLAGALRRARAATGPLQCLAIFTAVVLLTHMPSFYEATLRHPALHDAEHLAYLVAGLLLWWPLLDADPVAAHRLGGLGRLIYLLAAMPAMALVGAYLNRHQTLVYPAYGPPARALHVSALVDQAQAGAIMWVAGTIVMTCVGIWAAIEALRAEERRQAQRDARAWPENRPYIPVSRPPSPEGPRT